jgi:PTH1 family peptidyl-tRNA hydrolase
MVVEELARRHGLKFVKGQGNSEVARGSIAGNSVILAKPLTFMNNSGMAVGAVSRFYRVPIERILVVYDEIALPLGTLRLREKGSSAGHNGIKSLIHHLGTQNFPRLRVGVDQPSPGRHSQVDWVLSRFTSEEQKVIEETISRAADAIEAVMRDGIERAMNFYNAKESNAPASKASKPVVVKGSGVGDQEVAAAKQDAAPKPVATPSRQEKTDSWVDRVRRIIRGEGEAQ